MYIKAKRLPVQAHRHAQQAVELEPVAESYYVLCWACLRTGDQPGAVTAIKKAVELAPNHDGYRQLYEKLKERQ